MIQPRTDALMETNMLAELMAIEPETIRVIDATYFVPPDTRVPEEEFKARHIPGAVFFNIDAIADTSSTLPHMLPDAATFSTKVGALGVANHHHVVVYDVHGVMSAARAWWMFRVFGHNRVSVLNGGLPKWLREGRPVESGDSKPQSAETFTASFRPELVRDWRQVQKTLKNRDEQIIDARPAGRFLGQDPEPRAGLRLGHIPGSRNVPWGQLVHPDDKTLLDPAALQARFEAAGIDATKPVIASCGSGVTACVDALALYLLGNESVAVYDGSWAEWGAREDLPVARDMERV